MHLYIVGSHKAVDSNRICPVRIECHSVVSGSSEFRTVISLQRTVDFIALELSVKGSHPVGNYFSSIRLYVTILSTQGKNLIEISAHDHIIFFLMFCAKNLLDEIHLLFSNLSALIVCGKMRIYHYKFLVASFDFIAVHHKTTVKIKKICEP